MMAALDTLVSQSWWPATAAFVATVLSIFLLRPMARSIGLLDRPGGRKTHAAPTPLIGGLAVVIGCLPWALMTFEMTPAILALVVAGSVILLFGVLDDLFDLKWYYRLLGQAIAALALVYIGGGVKSVGPLVGLEPHTLGIWSLPFTVIATIGLINALNMTDGADGLAGATTITALSMMLAAAVYSGNARLGHGVMMIIAALFAFLAFNMRTPWRARADIFLGNAGSEFLGLVLAWVSFRLTQNLQHPVTPALAPFFLAPALIDCLTLMIRRMRNRKSPFTADRNHFHHLLLDAGFSTAEVVLITASISVLTGGVAAFAVKADIAGIWLIATFALMTLGYYWASRDRANFVKFLSGLLRATRSKSEGATPQREQLKRPF